MSSVASRAFFVRRRERAVVRWEAASAVRMPALRPSIRVCKAVTCVFRDKESACNVAMVVSLCVIGSGGAEAFSENFMVVNFVAVSVEMTAWCLSRVMWRSRICVSVEVRFATFVGVERTEEKNAVKVSSEYIREVGVAEVV